MPGGPGGGKNLDMTYVPAHSQRFAGGYGCGVPT